MWESSKCSAAGERRAGHPFWVHDVCDGAAVGQNISFSFIVESITKLTCGSSRDQITKLDQHISDLGEFDLKFLPSWHEDGGGGEGARPPKTYKSKGVK